MQPCYACGLDNPKKVVNLNRDIDGNRLCVKCWNHIIRRSGRRKGDNTRGKPVPWIDNSGDRNGSWKGGRSKAGQGYIKIKCAGNPRTDKYGYVLEHTLVMEQHIGRYLTPKETVHHKNGKTNDNRIENLQLFSSNREHLRYHRLEDIKNGIIPFATTRRKSSTLERERTTL